VITPKLNKVDRTIEYLYAIIVPATKRYAVDDFFRLATDLCVHQIPAWAFMRSFGRWLICFGAFLRLAPNVRMRRVGKKTCDGFL
jgi:hypothetical protein